MELRFSHIACSKEERDTIVTRVKQLALKLFLVYTISEETILNSYLLNITVHGRRKD